MKKPTSLDMEQPPLPEARDVLKAPVWVLGLVQIVLATDMFLECFVLTLLGDDAYYFAESRSTISFMGIVIGLWLLLTVFLLFGLLCNKPYLILPHFLFSLILLPLNFTMLAIVTHSSTFGPIFKSSFTICILSITIVYEYKCFQRMK